MCDGHSCGIHTYNCAVSRANGFVKLVTCECQFKEESSARTAGAPDPMPEEAAAATTMAESAAASAAAALPAGVLFINFCTRRCRNCGRAEIVENMSCLNLLKVFRGPLICAHFCKVECRERLFGGGHACLCECCCLHWSC